MTVEFVSSAELAFRKLVTGRTDVLLEARDLTPPLRSPEFRTIRILKPPLERIPMFHYIHKRLVAIVRGLEGVLTEMHETGVFERLRAEVMREYGIE
jgi:polar amino acid transport system substrate-binding protein